MNIIAFQSITTPPETITTNAVIKSEFQVSNFTNDIHKVINEDIVINVGIIKKKKVHNEIRFERGDSKRVNLSFIVTKDFDCHIIEGFKGFRLLKSHWHFKFAYRLVNVLLLICCRGCFVNMIVLVISIKTDSMMRMLRCHETITETNGIFVVSNIE